MRVIIYSRVSTTEQSEHGVSLDAQEAKNTAYAALYDLTVVAMVRDPGESGKSLNRPGLQQALAMLRRGEADGLICNKLDRLTRSIGDWQDLIDGYFGEKAKHPRKLFSVNDSIDTRTAAGRLVLNVLLSVAQWEREAIGERTKSALAHKITNGHRVGEVRYGFDLGDDGKTLVPNADEQETIKLMRRLREQGMSYRAIAEELDVHSVPTKNGGGAWSAKVVRAILKRAD